MPVFTMFDSLPSSLVCTVLRDWLNLKSVIALNSAFCQKSRREKFTSLLQSDEYFIRENIVFSDYSSIRDAFVTVGDKIRCLTFDNSSYIDRRSLIFQHCHNLTHLHFKDISSCTEEVLGVLLNKPRLECVTLSTPHAYYSCPPNDFLSVVDMQSEEFLRFAQGWGASDEDRIVALQKNAYATRLDFWGEWLPRSFLLQISQLCPHLTHLGVGGTNLDDEMLIEMVISCPNIEHLEIANNEQITDVGVLAVVQNLRRLKSLNILGMPKLTSSSFQHMCAHSARTLHTLHMSEFNTVRRGEGSGEDEEEEESEETNHGASAVNHLLEHCTQLRVFYYRYRKGFVFTPAAVCNLTTLVLDGGVVCKQNLSIISQYGVNLHTLLVGEITTYSRASLLALVQGCPRLRRFYYELEAIDMHNIDDYDSNTRQFALAFMDLWMKLKPGLVAEQSLANRFSFKVMDM